MQPGFWVDHLHPDDRVWAAEYCASCARRMEPHEFEYRFIARDGSTVWLHDLVTVVATDDATRWLRGLLVDVTGRKQAEAALRESESEIRKLNEELDARVKARTAELESAVADLEGFSYSVSHDLRAPLRAIDGFSSIIREDYAPALDDAGKELFQGIRRNAQRMGELIDDILVFSRVGRHEMQTGPLDMKTLAATVWQELAAQRSDASNSGCTTCRRASASAVQQVLEPSNAIVQPGRARRIEVGGRAPRASISQG
jgi:signal transduction histidine kinase